MGQYHGEPYALLAGSVPPERIGVCMGIFHMFIVISMIVQIFTLPLIYRTWLGANRENVIRLAGALLLCAAVATPLLAWRRSLRQDSAAPQPSE